MLQFISPSIFDYMPNISGLYSQSTGLPPSDWKIIQALRFLCSDAVFFRSSDFFLFTSSCTSEEDVFVEKKVASSDNQAIRQACLKLNIDKSSCRRYLEHLEFLALKADKRNLERKTIPEGICWESRLRDDVELRLTNKQLRFHLRQEGLMVSGNKAQLVERIL